MQGVGVPGSERKLLIIFGKTFPPLGSANRSSDLPRLPQNILLLQSHAWGNWAADKIVRTQNKASHLKNIQLSDLCLPVELRNQANSPGCKDGSVSGGTHHTMRRGQDKQLRQLFPQLVSCSLPSPSLTHSWALPTHPWTLPHLVQCGHTSLTDYSVLFRTSQDSWRLRNPWKQCTLPLPHPGYSICLKDSILAFFNTEILPPYLQDISLTLPTLNPCTNHTAFGCIYLWIGFTVWDAKDTALGKNTPNNRFFIAKWER